MLAQVEKVRRGWKSEAMEAFVPLRPANVPAWNCYTTLSSLAGETGEIRVADIAAHCDFLSIHDPRMRRRIYRHVAEIRREHRSRTRPAKPEGGD